MPTPGRMIDYLRGKGGECSVVELIENSGAERLRVFSLIVRLSTEEKLKITRFDSWGAPLTVALPEN